MGIEFILGVKLLSFNLVAALPILELKGLELKGVGLSLIHISEPTRQVLVSRMPSSA